MKTFLKRFFLFVTLILVILIGIIWYFYQQSKLVIQAEQTDTIVTISRAMKASIRNKINSTANASLVQILQASYNLLHTYNNTRMEKSTQTTREHSIKHKNSIVDIAITLPSSIVQDIQIDTQTPNNLTFKYKTQFIWSLTVYNDKERSTQEEIWLFNQEKIAEQDEYVISYAQVLDNPFEGIELETFGEIVYAFNKAINSIQILHIAQIEQTIWYIIDIENLIVTIHPASILTGESAAQALAEREPDLCKSIISGTDQTLCFPPNDIYIIKNDDKESIIKPFIADEWLQTKIQLFSGDDNTQTKNIDILTFINERKENFDNTLFEIEFVQEGIIHIKQYYTP
jgi:hypothetical protein